MKPLQIIAWETVLILSSVMVFRSLWMLMDRSPVLSSTGMLALLLALGVVLSVPALYKLTTCR